MMETTSDFGQALRTTSCHSPSQVGVGVRVALTWNKLREPSINSQIAWSLHRIGRLRPGQTVEPFRQLRIGPSVTPITDT